MLWPFELQLKVLAQHRDEIVCKLLLQHKHAWLVFFDESVVSEFIDKLCSEALIADSFELVVLILHAEIVVEHFFERDRAFHIVVGCRTVRSRLKLEVEPLRLYLKRIDVQVGCWVH